METVQNIQCIVIVAMQEKLEHSLMWDRKSAPMVHARKRLIVRSNQYIKCSTGIVILAVMGEVHTVSSKK